DHLYEVARAGRSAVQVAELFRGRVARSTGRAFGGAETGGQRTKDRIEHLHRFGLASDHQAIAPVETENAAAGANVDVVDAARLEPVGAIEVIAVVAVAAVDQNVALVDRLG